MGGQEGGISGGGVQRENRDTGEGLFWHREPFWGNVPRSGNCRSIRTSAVEDECEVGGRQRP